MKQLREKALRYRLSVRSDANRMIDAIMSHLETHSPLIEMLQPPGENNITAYRYNLSGTVELFEN